MRPLYFLLFIAISSACAAEGTPAPRRSVGFGQEVMGTWGSIVIVTADSSAVASQARSGLREFARVDSLMSNWTDTSEIARLNREAGRGTTSCDAEVAQVIAAALALSRDSDGAFDPTVEPLVRAWGFLQGEPARPEPGVIEELQRRVGAARIELDLQTLEIEFDHPQLRIDLGGIAKGHAVDLVRALLHRQGVTDALIDLSGNMAALGHPPGRDSWTVGIRDPEDRADYFARLRLEDQAVATSGNYEQFVDVDGKRYGHVLDPRTGWPAEGLEAVTVLAPTARDADGWATALLVLGPERARQVVQDRDDLAAILVQPAMDGRRRVWVSASLKTRFSLAQEMQRHYDVRWF